MTPDCPWQYWANNILLQWLCFPPCKIGIIYAFIPHIFIDYYTGQGRMGYAVVISSLILSGCIPLVYFTAPKIHSGFGQFSRTAVHHEYTQHSRLSQSFGISIMNMSFQDLHARKIKGLKSQESTVTRNRLEETTQHFYSQFLGKACDMSCSKNVSTWYFWDSLVAQSVKNLPEVQETWVWPLGWEDLMKKEMATHSNILAWRIPWTEEPGGLYSLWGHKELDITERLIIMWYVFL